ncbi:hypothetical protein FNV43_RR09922 [Rhamnella rubrinervis]|uniref:DUF4378 domain-containing protein n=1 Tax=Rhamnella rubrinervis TaxID=2594499 RepID=A0A8K0MK86_9ROSA|nr:hypothetical protein FNV43_RR09922 [Rhamnella rubrinervis]
MGKNLQQKNSGISSQNNTWHAGCAWGMFHVINYHQWRHVKKRLNYKRGGGDKHMAAGNPENDRNASSANNKVEEEDDDDAERHKSTAKEKMEEESSPPKDGSIKARVIELAAEEVSKMMKGQEQHRRNSTNPRRSLKRTLSIHHHLEPEISDPLDEILKDESNLNKASNLDSPPENSCEGATKDSNLVGSSDEVDKHEKKTVENESAAEGKLDNIMQDMLKQPNVDPSFYSSKEFMDVLDLISANKELLLKILHDPRSPLAHYFHRQQALSTKMGLTKSESFPVHGCSWGRQASGPEHNHQCSASLAKEEVIKSENQKVATTSSQASAQLVKNQGENQVVSKRFKDLKQKIKHVIEDSKKEERRRISMDAILHKIPHGQTLSDQKLEEIDSQLKKPAMNREGKNSATSGYENSFLSPSVKRKQVRHMRRTSSLNESIDRYCQLYENTFSQEAKQHTPDNLKVRTKEAGSTIPAVPKHLARILSLPDLESYVYQSQESYCTFSSEAPSRSSVDNNVGLGSSFVERTSPDDAESMKSVMQENSEEVSEVSSLASSSLANVLDGPDKLDKQEQESSVVTAQPSESEWGIENVETPERDLVYDMRHLQVDANDKAEFSYVRDVLELSGFSGNGFLGTWHSEDQPVDPLVYEAVEGCLFLDPDCSGNEGGKCDHMLMFDLINEVLMEIYGRSYSYYPKPLSWLSHIRPMPVGHHVLSQVWELISCYLSLRPEVDKSLDYVLNADLAKGDGWMNLQFDTECVALELEDLVFDDILEELVFDDLLELLWT